MLPKPTLLFHTLRHLKFRQLSVRLRQAFVPYCGVLERCRRRRVPVFQGCRLAPGQTWLAPGLQNNASVDVLSGRLTFINEQREMGWPLRWDDLKPSLLWRYNLHYFEWLWALDFDSARAAALDWIRNYPLQHDHRGWDPYPVSLRLMNWVSVFFGRYKAETLGDDSFLDELWRSLALQAEWLWVRRETHLLGNHYLENGAALAFIGSCFKGSEADCWFQRGKSILSREIPEQILPDGLHFERSPMYHLRVVYLLLLLHQVGRPDLRQLVSDPLLRALRAMRLVCHPDGQIALFNDSAFGIYNTPRELAEQARSLGLNVSEAPVGAWALPDAGYYGFRDAQGNYIICDAGAVGPDYIPGHAHADMFSFELSLHGQRVVVDSGVYGYERGAMRDYCRSTRAHNTVEINGQDQCEMWAAFRVARRGKPRDVRWVPGEDGFTLDAWHDGYHRLAGRPMHFRRFCWNGEGLVIEDRIESRSPAFSVTRFHLHPDCRIREQHSGHALAGFHAGEVRISWTGHDGVCCEESRYCPKFGVHSLNSCLAILSNDGCRQITTQITISETST